MSDRNGEPVRIMMDPDRLVAILVGQNNERLRARYFRGWLVGYFMRKASAAAAAPANKTAAPPVVARSPCASATPSASPRGSSGHVTFTGDVLDEEDSRKPSLSSAGGATAEDASPMASADLTSPSSVEMQRTIRMQFDALANKDKLINYLTAQRDLVVAANDVTLAEKAVALRERCNALEAELIRAQNTIRTIQAAEMHQAAIVAARGSQQPQQPTRTGSIAARSRVQQSPKDSAAASPVAEALPAPESNVPSAAASDGEMQGPESPATAGRGSSAELVVLPTSSAKRHSQVSTTAQVPRGVALATRVAEPPAQTIVQTRIVGNAESAAVSKQSMGVIIRPKRANTNTAARPGAASADTKDAGRRKSEGSNQKNSGKELHTASAPDSARTPSNTTLNEKSQLGPATPVGNGEENALFLQQMLQNSAGVRAAQKRASNTGSSTVNGRAKAADAAGPSSGKRSSETTRATVSLPGLNGVTVAKR